MPEAEPEAPSEAEKKPEASDAEDKPDAPAPDRGMLGRIFGGAGQAQREEVQEPEPQEPEGAPAETPSVPAATPPPPPIEEPEQTVPEGETINLNGATFEQLREAGFSVTQATRVITYRERQSGFKSVDDLDAVPGMPRSFLRNAKRRLTL
ncbi:MAG: hypothetical protein EXQ70_09550 [Solirubrobacterales bacterium]|nr:hypothetical protein [Solirubrobacterales bacterium]